MQADNQESPDTWEKTLQEVKPKTHKNETKGNLKETDYADTWKLKDAGGTTH